VTDLQSVGFKYSAGSNYNGGTALITPKPVANTSYCIEATSASGKLMHYDSQAGGLVMGSLCP
jgi:hypothetical protein